MNNSKISILILVIGFMLNSASGQLSSRLDQFYLDPSTVNAGAITAYKEANVSLYYNRTYNTMPGGPRNMLLNVALPSADHRKGFGLFYMKENAGFSQLHNAYASYSYAIPVGLEGNLGLGVSLGVLSQSFDASKAVYISQNDPIVHSLLFSPTATRADLRASVYYSSGGFAAGVSTSRLPKPRFDYSYYNYTAKYTLQNVTNLYASYNWDLNYKAKIRPSILVTAFDFDYFKFQANISYVYMDKFWLGVNAGDATHLGGNIGFMPHEGTKVGYQVNFQSGTTSAILGPVHEFYVGIGLGSLSGKAIEKEKMPSDFTPVTDNNVIGKRRLKYVTVKSLVELQMEGLDLDTFGISFAPVDKTQKTPGIFLVVGLHSSELNAEKQIKELYMQGMCAFKFYDPINKSFYVYIKQFASVSEASAFIMNNDTGLPQAWIREVK